MTTWNENLPFFLKYNTENFFKFLRKNPTTWLEIWIFHQEHVRSFEFLFCGHFLNIIFIKKCEYFLVLEFFRRVLTIATIRKLWGPQINLNIHRRNHFSWFIYNFIYLIFLNAKVFNSYFFVFSLFILSMKNFRGTVLCELQAITRNKWSSRSKFCSTFIIASSYPCCNKIQFHLL